MTMAAQKKWFLENTGRLYPSRWVPGIWVATNRVTGKKVQAHKLSQFECDRFRAAYGLPKYIGKQAASETLKWWDRSYQRSTRLEARLRAEGGAA